MRALTVVFARVALADVDPRGAPLPKLSDGAAGVARGQAVCRALQEAVGACEGEVNKILIDDKGFVTTRAFVFFPCFFWWARPVRDAALTAGSKQLVSKL